MLKMSYFCIRQLQTPPTQSQTESTLQSDLLPELTDAPPDPPTEHIAPPPSTVDTAALNEEPEPGEEGGDTEGVTSPLPDCAPG